MAMTSGRRNIYWNIFYIYLYNYLYLYLSIYIGWAQCGLNHPPVQVFQPGPDQNQLGLSSWLGLQGRDG